jgi:Icc protein
VSTPPQARPSATVALVALSFAQITDHHLTAAHGGLARGFSPDFALRAVLRDLAERAGDDLDFVVSTGDAVERPGDEVYRHARLLLELGRAAEGPAHVQLRAEGLDVPAYLYPGNHDDRELFYRVLLDGSGQPPGHRSFECGGVRFLWTDWGERGQARADDELFSFLERELTDVRPTIVLTHHHFVALGARWLDALLPPADESARFFATLAGRSVLAVLSGHAHNTYACEIAGVPVYGLRATAWQFALTDAPLPTLEPPSYRLVTVDDGRFETDVVEVPLPE